MIRTEETNYPGTLQEGLQARHDRKIEQGRSNVFSIEIPIASLSEKFSMRHVRDKHERLYLAIIWCTNLAVFGGLIFIAAYNLNLFFVIASWGLLIAIVSWLSWKLMFVFLYGNSIEVSTDQYQQVYRVVKQACDYLEMKMPTVLIVQGHGVFELFVARRFSQRGFLIITSNMMDEFAKKPSSREFMMYVGRQLGHIKARHLALWFFKDVVGSVSLFFYAAWKRRCHYTADKIGLLAAGDLYAAEQALLMVTAGAGIAPSTNYDAVVEQRTKLFESFWAWLRLSCSTYPFMIDSIVKLREFASSIGMQRGLAGVMPIEHTSLKSLPILIIHGRDKLALLELKDFLYTSFPQIVPRVMASITGGTLALPEKFDRVTSDVHGAIALLTPDDVGASVADEAARSSRARQNVVMEIGWAWGKLGRQRCLLLIRGSLELPSDLSGVDAYTFERSPEECFEAVRSFLNQMILDISS